MISYHYLCVFTRHSCILFTFVPISLMFVQWLHRFLRKWASRAFPASSQSAGARTLRCSWRPVKMGSRAGFLCLFGPRPGHCQFVFPTLTDERRVQAVYKGNNDGQLEEHTSQLVDFDVFCLVNHIPSDSRCPVRNSSHSSPASYVFCILKVVVLPLVTPGGCVGAGHHIGQPCCSGCPRAAVNQQRRPPCVEGMGWLMFGSTDVIFL